MQEFVRRAGLEDALGAAGGPKFIHVAGTNGKGSVTAFLQSILVDSGYRTGAFFSPYVFDPRERIQFGKEMIQREMLAHITSDLKPIAESLSETEFGGVTEFEFKTAVGFEFWKRMRCDWVALEVGLGGRLDATNVVTPCASVIVSIGLDHTNVLGETHEKIAYEKAGVIKPGVPLVLGEMPPEAREVILGIAEANDAPIWEIHRQIILTESHAGVSVDIPDLSAHGLRLGLRGAKQAHNLALAIGAMAASGALKDVQAIQSGSETASLPGRMQMVHWRSRQFLLDGAHNAEAAEVLRESLPDARNVVLVAGMVAGHDPARFFEAFTEVASIAHLTPISFHRGVPPSEIESQIHGVMPCKAHVTLAAALEAAIEDTTSEDLIVVTGSFYLVGEVGRLIGAYR